MMAVVFIIFCGEGAYYGLYDSIGEKMYHITFDGCYDTEQCEKDVEELFTKYDVNAFYPINEDSDSKNDIWVCTNSCQEKIKEILGLDNCRFNTILSGKHSIIFTDPDNVENVVSREYSIFDIYLYADKITASDICGELSKKYLFESNSPQKASNSTVIVWLICASLLLLLSIYDVFDSKKEVCIKLTLGNSLKRQLGAMILKDTLIFALLASITALVLYNATAVILIIKTYAFFVLSICLMNALIFFSLYLVDICSTLKNENGSSGYLHINYMLKAASSAALIFFFSMISIPMQQIEERKCAEDFGDRFSKASYIQTYESPLWSSMIDAASRQYSSDSEDSGLGSLFEKKYRDDDKFIRQMDEKYGIFFLGNLNYYTNDIPYDGSTNNILLASDITGEYIANETGIAPSPEGITVYLPKEYKNLQLDLVKQWIKAQQEYYSFDVIWQNYDSALFMGTDFINKDRITANLCINVADSPVIVYVADSAKFDYFGRTDFFVMADRKSAESIRKKNMIISLMTESVPVNTMISDYKRKTSSISVLFILMIISLMVYYIAVLICTLTVDININKRERAVLKILGRNAVSRYIRLLMFFMLTLALSTTVWLLIRKISLGSMLPLFTAAAVMFILECAAVIIAAKLDEKHNTLKELKGGAL
jgi:hypothetical protein